MRTGQQGQRRRGRRSGVGILALVLCLGACGGQSRTVHSAPPPSGSSAPPSGSSAPPTLSPSQLQHLAGPPVPTVSNPWSAYRTAVNPGSRLLFSSSNVVWEIPDLGMSHVDNNLKAGPYDSNFAQPGTLLYRSTTGGTNWTTAYSDATGIWGFDFISPTQGWVVNVTSLVTTSDGGAHWKTVSEPSGTALVRVAFVNEVAGYGITSQGGLVTTNDGGSSWQTASLAEPAAAMCLSGSALFIGTEAGNVYTTSIPDGSASEVFRSALQAPEHSLWIDMSCEENTIAVSETDASPAGGKNPTFEIVASGDSGRTWPLLADSGQNAQRDIPAGPMTLPGLTGILASRQAVSAASASGQSIQWTTVSLTGRALLPQSQSLYHLEPGESKDRLRLGGLALSATGPVAELNLIGFSGTNSTITPLLADGRPDGTQWSVLSRGPAIAVPGSGS